MALALCSWLCPNCTTTTTIKKKNSRKPQEGWVSSSFSLPLIYWLSDFCFIIQPEKDATAHSHFNIFVKTCQQTRALGETLWKHQSWHDFSTGNLKCLHTFSFSSMHSSRCCSLNSPVETDPACSANKTILWIHVYELFFVTKAVTPSHLRVYKSLTSALNCACEPACTRLKGLLKRLYQMEGSTQKPEGALLIS